MHTKRWYMILLSLVALSALGLSACAGSVGDDTRTVGTAVVPGTGATAAPTVVGTTSPLTGTSAAGATSAPLGTSAAGGTAVIPQPGGTVSAVQPSVTVQDQSVQNGTVTI